MAARILDGKQVAADLRDELAGRIAALRERGTRPTVAVVRVGEDEAAASYTRSLQRSFDRADVGCRVVSLAAAASTDQVAATLDDLGGEAEVHGILLQEPLPAGIEAARLIDHLDPAKDVDGVHPLNAGLLYANRPGGFVPATALGGLLLLERQGVDIEGRRAVVIGRSEIVGRPMALLLLHRHATVTVCHSRTRDLSAVAREADLLVAALGRAHYVTPEFVKPGAIVLDFGTTYGPDGVQGDVDPAVAEIAGAWSPTPGGTGPVTSATLLHNVVQAAERSVARTSG